VHIRGQVVCELVVDLRVDRFGEPGVDIRPIITEHTQKLAAVIRPGCGQPKSGLGQGERG